VDGGGVLRRRLPEDVDGETRGPRRATESNLLAALEGWPEELEHDRLKSLADVLVDLFDAAEGVDDGLPPDVPGEDEAKAPLAALRGRQSRVVALAPSVKPGGVDLVASDVTSDVRAHLDGNRPDLLHAHADAEKVEALGPSERGKVSHFRHECVCL